LKVVILDSGIDLSEGRETEDGLSPWLRATIATARSVHAFLDRPGREERSRELDMKSVKLQTDRPASYEGSLQAVGQRDVKNTAALMAWFSVPYFHIRPATNSSDETLRDETAVHQREWKTKVEQYRSQVEVGVDKLG